MPLNNLKEKLMDKSTILKGERFAFPICPLVDSILWSKIRSVMQRIKQHSILFYSYIYIDGKLCLNPFQEVKNVSELFSSSSSEFLCYSEKDFSRERTTESHIFYMKFFF